jgi:hypothetical protein
MAPLHLVTRRHHECEGTPPLIFNRLSLSHPPPKRSPRVLQRSISSSSHTCCGGGTAIWRQVDHKDEARFQYRTPGSHLVKGQVSGSVFVDDVKQGVEPGRETSWGLLTGPLGERIIGAIR